MTKTAVVVYWFDGSSLLPDGGGLRVLAWKRALESAGYQAEIHGLLKAHTSSNRSGLVGRLKRAVIPMPLSRRVSLHSADLVVSTVPATFGSFAGSGRTPKLLFDWMDRWSQNALNLGMSSPMSAVGGAVQSAIWQRRERKYPAFAHRNFYAGFGDVPTTSERVGEWLPSPVDRGHRSPRARPERLRGARLGIIANFHYRPNVVSVGQFLRGHGCQLSRAGVELVVAGFGTEQVRHWPEYVRVLGEVSTPEDFYNRVDGAIVPIEHGGGIKVKAVEALATGVPVFGTAHVRGGFSAHFRSWIAPLESMYSVDTWPGLCPESVYDATFSTAAFDARVAGSIADIEKEQGE